MKDLYVFAGLLFIVLTALAICMTLVIKYSI